jgi:hypothetical protein
VIERLEVDLAADRASRQDRFDFGCEVQALADDGVVKRLYPYAIPCQ